MTKNHILIKSVALGVLLTFSPFAKASGSVDRVLVTYFNVLYKEQSPKCTIDEATKTRLLAEFDSQNCFIKNTVNNEQYISGVKSPCTQASLKSTVDSRVDVLCVNTAAQAEKAAIAKAQANAAAAKQANGGSGSSSAAVAAQNLQATIPLVQSMVEISKSSQQKPPVTATGAGSNAAGSAIKEIPQVGTSTAIDHANAAIRQENVAHAVANSSPKLTPETMQYKTADGGYISAAVNEEGAVKLIKFDKSGAAQPGGAEFGKMTESGQVNAKIQEMGGDPNKPVFQQDPAFAKAAEEAPATVKNVAQKATDGSAATGMDETLEARKAKAEAEDKALDTEIQAMKKQLKAAKQGAPNEATEKCNANEATRDPVTMQTKNPVLEKECNLGEPQKAIICLETNLQQLEAANAKLKTEKLSCSDSSAQAEKLCSMVRSEKAQQVQQVMSLGATVLSKMTAASEACGTTSTLSKIAQGGMLAAQGACSAMKFRCDMSCDSAEATIKLMKTKAELIQKCPLTLEAIATAGAEAQKAAGQLVAKLNEQLTPEKSVPSAIVQCKKHTLDMATMGAAALGFLSAFQDAQTCKEQLAASSGGGSGKSSSGLAGPSMTTAEYCGQPQNAASITCKCTANPNAEGCTGSLIGSGVSLGKINTNGGASGFASAKQNGLSSIDPVKKSGGESSEPPPGAGLSEAAREALGIGTASLGGSSGAAGNFGSASENAKAAKEEKEKPKYGFFSSLGSMLSGGKSANQAAKAAIRNYEQDQAIKRKVASEQLRAEITTASGKSNFDKIRSRYRENASSFEQ